MHGEPEQDGEGDQDGSSGQSREQGGTRVLKPKLARVIPTERVSFDKQMSVLRAYAAASGPGKKPVTNDEVAAVLNDLASSSISLCNPFFSDVGLLVQDGRRQRPADVVFDYHHAYEWNPETAALKLKPAFIDSWAAHTLLPKLSFRQLTRDEAIQFLADESKAQKSHRKNLDLLLEFLNASGVLKMEGNTVSKNQSGPMQPAAAAEQPAANHSNAAKPAAEQRRIEEPENANVERFTIPIPGKDAAVITVPRDLDADDWDMLSLMIETYIKRLRKESTKGSNSS